LTAPTRVAATKMRRRLTVATNPTITGRPPSTGGPMTRSSTLPIGSPSTPNSGRRRTRDTKTTVSFMGTDSGPGTAARSARGGAAGGGAAQIRTDLGRFDQFTLFDDGAAAAPAEDGQGDREAPWPGPSLHTNGTAATRSACSYSDSASASTSSS